MTDIEKSIDTLIRLKRAIKPDYRMNKNKALQAYDSDMADIDYAIKKLQEIQETDKANREKIEWGNREMFGEDPTKWGYK